ncbi:hypothetical protein RD110_15795 [Rhodoferax koreense]|uniref:Exonuclease domain-containing protein n=1 Tax=Rhodoferax koreensis TaxID=1842727 RepID=A0A1P8JXJ4_9BURK|nr:3'-5' exonuclease [Rhodoferax koreense]APW38484.1 hypothetical protein RD110_15795 [Rhodoferax koreense]
MNLALGYDTETSGLPLFSSPSEHPDQPHIVQLAGLLVDLDTRRTVASMDVVIRPEGWVITEEMAAIHGITHEHAMDVGIAEDLAVEMFMALWAGRPLIAHNESFDRRIVRIAQHRFPEHFSDQQRDDWKACKAHCTQILSTPILKLPPTPKMVAARRNHHKSANLGEAYQFFMGKPLENAHSALADTRAALDVFFAIQDLNKPATQATAPAAAAPAAAEAVAGDFF